MDEFRAHRICVVEIETLEQRQLLQHHRALRPGAGLAGGVAAIVVGERRLDMGLPARHVLAGEHAAMPLAAGVHDLLGAAEAIDRLGDEALRPGHARLLDLLDPIAAGALGLAQHARIGLGQRRVGEQRADRRHVAARQIDRRRRRPMLFEQLLDGRDGGVRALDQRMAMAGVIDRGRQHVGEPHGAVVAQQQHPGVEHARHAGGKQAGARHHVEAAPAVMGDGGRGRRRTLPADHLDLALAHVVQDDRNVAARPVEMRLDHLQREGGGDRGVEGVAALLQRRHADRGGDPMGRGDDAERALDLGPRGERIRIDVFH